MPSLHSIALLALTGAASAYPWTENHVAHSFEVESSGPNLMARDAGSFSDDFDDLTEFYQRDAVGPYLEGQVLVRSVKGGSKPSKSSGGGGGGHQKSTASKILRGVGKGTNAFGDIGTGLTGIADVAGLFKSNGNGNSGGTTQSRRDLEDLDDGSGLFAREARGSRRHHSGSSLGHIASAAGHRASHSHGAFDHLGQGLSGISNFAGLFQSNGGSSGSGSSNTKRDLEDLLDSVFEIYARGLDLEDLEY
ncbi:MAG: hypothetical protein GOMPHAMPRED_003801 [Gomphillus americanus]|uniref:Uncharacterized protein n=1 Tax=Gomphillus americanus TaxID=1940652 RepID=A0A8H3FFE2_9LECA|nr:MAG: hypothetical protein GOMPHAMPRED_003801 [Gomphillus americanus]